MFTGKSVCKYLGGQNGVTVSVVSSCGANNSSGSIINNTTSNNSAIGADSGSGESTTVDDVDGDSDGEVSRIDFRGVNLRTKKKRDGGPGSLNNSEDACGANDSVHQQPERPMSWEGELSDQEMSSNTITNQVLRAEVFFLKDSTFPLSVSTLDFEY